MRKHIKAVHLGIKEQECDLCSNKFVTRANLARHMRVHSGDKLYKCSGCSITFTCLGNLAANMARHK